MSLPQDESHSVSNHVETEHVESDLLDAETRRQLIEDDREAWKTIVSLLLVIVVGGLCLGFCGVAMCIFF